MQNYENLIYSQLDGETPKQKHENHVEMIRLLYKVAFPGRGSQEEAWDIQIVAEKAQKLLKIDKKY